MSLFADEINTALEKVHTKAQGIVSEAALELQKQVVNATPVDTGQAKSNWFIEINQCSCKQTKDTQQGNLAEARQTFAQFSGGLARLSCIYLYNNLPYIGVLEYGLYPNPPKVPTGKTINGYSTQAPEGFFRLAVAGWQQTVQRIAEFRKDDT